MKPTFAERLWLRVDVSAGAAGCWPWTGALNAAGYGAIGSGSRVLRVHRATYEALVGPIPAGMDLDHLCRNRACANPAHLEPVSNRENWRRGRHWSATAVRDRICKRGHPLTPENTYTRKSGGILCRTCVLANNRAYRVRRLKREQAAA